MRRTHRFGTQFVSWTLLSVCFALAASFFTVISKNPTGRGSERVSITSAGAPGRGGVSTARSHHTRTSRSLPQAEQRAFTGWEPLADSMSSVWLSTATISNSGISLFSRADPNDGAFNFMSSPMPQSGSPKIAFASNREGTSQLYSMNNDGSGLLRLTNDAANDEMPRWSPNNSRIVFQSDRDNVFSGSADIYVMNWDGSGQARLTSDPNDDSAPIWSPDGTKIAFQSARNGVNYQIYVMNADGSGQTNVSNTTANDVQPSWSPDGTKIAFASDRDQAGFSSIYLMNANGSGQTRLTFSGNGFGDEQPAWSPNGSKIAFVSTRDSVLEQWQETDDFEIPEDDGQVITKSKLHINKEVYVMNADGNAQVRLTNTLENDDSAAWSGDGTKIVFRSDRELECCDPTEQIWVMNADGSNQTNLSNNGFGDHCPNWQHVSTNVPPSVSITGPANGATFNAPANISLLANASDVDGAITKVDFYQGATLIGTDTTAPYRLDWNNVSAGSYSLTAKATDNVGETNTSGPVAVTVNAAPSVTITSPANGGSFSTPANISITANATDSDGTISRVDFYQGANFIGTATASPYTISWNNVEPGNYSLTARARDNAGATTTSNPVSASVTQPQDAINLALNKPATQSSIAWGGAAPRGTDGNTDGDFWHYSVTHTTVENQPWWQVDLLSVSSIQTINVWNRTDCCGEALTNFYVFVSDNPFAATDVSSTQSQPGVSTYYIAGQGGVPSNIAVNRTGRYVRVQLGNNERLSVAEVQVLGTGGTPSANLALNRPAMQSSTGYDAIAQRGVDGNPDGNFWHYSVTHTSVENQPWWQVDLQIVSPIQYISVWNRTDCCGEALSNFYVFVSDNPFTSTDVSSTQSQPGVSSYYVTGQGDTPSHIMVNRTGRYVRVQLGNNERLSVAEVQVFGPPPPTGPNASTFVSQSVPWTMLTGHQYAVSVTFKNTGSNTWTSGNHYSLGSQNPQDNSTWGVARAALPADIAPGQQVSFNFTVTAPATGGRYNFQWRMVQDTVEWFGDYTTNIERLVNAPPTVSITSPANGATLVAPMSIPIAVNASDSDGTITSVWFYQGTTLIWIDDFAPYDGFHWDCYTPGNYSLTAVAWDNNYASTTSAPVNITVNPNSPPTVSITSPANGASFIALANIPITANPSDSDGTISRVTFFQGTTWIGWSFSYPWSINWANVPAGTYSLTARATDSNSGITSSNPITVTVNPPPAADARLDPTNRTGGAGEDPLSRNFNWSLPLVGLPGRAGLDLGLSLSYNSLATWTRSGSYISFDDDRGFPAPGFRLGFPVIQPAFYNSQAGKYSYLLITPSGARVELRQVGSSSLYQAVDSSYLLLDANTMTLRTTDGTQLSYAWMGSDYECTKIKDRNGNFITVNYDALGRLDTVVDTLARTIKFNYDANGLNSITQAWTVNGQLQTHYWARFTYTDQPIQTNFPGLNVIGPQNNTTLHVLSSVKLADDSRFDFSYSSWGQIWKVSNYAIDGHLLNYRSYDLPQDNSTAQSDCPRFTQRHDWAENWNRDASGNAQEVGTSFSALTSVTIPGTSTTGTFGQITLPDGTSEKIYFGSANTVPAWENGLALLTETYDSNSVKQRWVTTTWRQDDETITYPLNPRVTETNIYDPAGNRARARVDYATFNLPDGTSCRYPQDSYEYQGNGATVLRRTRTEYNMDAAYTDRRIIGLPSAKYLCDGSQGEVPCNDQSGTALLSKVTLQYDESGSIQGTDAPVHHDNSNYGAGFIGGRANLSSVRRYDVSNISQFTTSTIQYNTAGAVVATHDPLNHGATISYVDSFSDLNNSRNTFAYPTTVTDADGYSSTARYNFDFGALTRKQKPLPNVNDNQPGPVQTIEYDSIGRLQRGTNIFNGSYTRYEYGPNFVQSYATVNNVADEAYSLQVFDGAGRLIAKASNHPGSSGGYSAQVIIYDAMGQMIKQSNPTESNLATVSLSVPLHPYDWQATGDDATANGGTGWAYAQQTYDWKGRPLVTTNKDTTTKSASYSGCGCAGGEVATLMDEMNRRQKVYSDVLGRTAKTEVLNWDGSVYAATVSSYNARDQVTLVRQYQGNDQSGVYQDTTVSYDGYGRLASKHVPEQNAGTATVYAYNSDDTVQLVTDARGASASYIYNNGRHLVNGINYSAPSGVTPTPNVTFGYDAAGNRTSMSDGFGSKTYNYNQLSQLMSETRAFNGVGSFTLSYDYNFAGELKKITDATNMTINYGYDSTGRLNGVTGADNLYAGVSNYASNFQYRAWGGLKTMTDGSNHTSSLSYNSKLQPSQFDISGGVVHQNYDYYNDGRISFVHNTTDVNFDRSYSYDHTARLTLATTGGTARGDSAATPYHETFGYDALSNLTSRFTSSWNQNEFSDGATYANNRRSDWGYDADGRNTTIDTRTYTFDASGQQTLMTGQKWVVNHYVASSTATNYNADGASIKNVADGITTYYLRSSALGGAIIEELNSSGQKNAGYVYYAGGRELATQTNNEVIWKHSTPANTSKHEIHSTNGFAGRIEFDPVGADVKLEAPLTPDPGSGQGDVDSRHVAALMDSKYAAFNNPAGGCVVDSFETSCANAMAHVNFGTGNSTGFVNNGSVTMHDLAHSAMLSASPQAIFAPVGNSIAGINPGESDSGESKLISGGTAIQDSATGNWFGEMTIAPATVTGLSSAVISFASSIQLRPQIIPLGNVKSNIEALLKHGDCEEFTNRVLAALAKKYADPGHLKHINTVMEGYNMIQAQGRYVLEPSGISTVRGDLFNDSSNYDVGPGTVVIAQTTQFITPTAAQTTIYQALYAFAALHETFHLGKRGGYTDEQVATTMLELDGMSPLTTLRDGRLLSSLSPQDDTRIDYFSNQLDQALKRHCGYPTTPLRK